MKRSNTPQTPHKKGFQAFFKNWDKSRAITEQPEEKMRAAFSYEKRLFRERLWWMASSNGLYTYDPRTDVVRFYSDDKKEVGTIVTRGTKVS